MAPRPSVLLLVAVLVLAAACTDDGPNSKMQRIPIEVPTTAATSTSGPSGSDGTSATVPMETSTPSTPSTPAHDRAPIEELTFSLELIGSFEQPIDLATRPGDEALYIAEKTGRVYRISASTPDPSPLLDLSSRVSTEGERGLLGITFTPDGQRFVASYTDLDGTSVIESWSSSSAPPCSGSLDGSAGQQHLTVGQPFANHNGGDIAYGPDGHLYIALGDGG
ncbi:MAG: PQQ-dependent sugar dehydrogenase, partial [Actinomycetota bacterium]|nr:PQQ-dependent sugar dehydrogenase [Actinomycetota bacterium]